MELPTIVDYAIAKGVDLMGKGLSLTQAVHHARKWHASIRREVERNKVVPGQTVFQWEDGWTVQELSSLDCLRTEAGFLQHCLWKQPHYRAAFEAGTNTFYSLRDPSGTPKVTIQYDNVEQRTLQTKMLKDALPYTEEICKKLAEFLSTLTPNWMPNYDMRGCEKWL